MRARRGAHHDSVAPVERFDDPAFARVKADMPGPPQDVAGAHLIERYFGQHRRDRIGGSRQANTRRAPRALDEPGTIEAGGPGATPAIAFADLGPGKSDHG